MSRVQTIQHETVRLPIRIGASLLEMLNLRNALRRGCFWSAAEARSQVQR